MHRSLLATTSTCSPMSKGRVLGTLFLAIVFQASWILIGSFQSHNAVRVLKTAQPTTIWIRQLLQACSKWESLSEQEAYQNGLCVRFVGSLRSPLWHPRASLLTLCPFESTLCPFESPLCPFESQTRPKSNRFIILHLFLSPSGRHITSPSRSQGRFSSKVATCRSIFQASPLFALV